MWEGALERPLRERYELLHQSAQSGFARLYKARDIILDRLVAIKVLNAEVLDASWVVENERLALTLLTHRNIVRLLDSGRLGETPALVMEWLSGTTLDAAAARTALPDLVGALTDISRALVHAHSKGIVHCDLKPRNIHVNEDACATLLDFAIADIPGHSFRKSGYICGTPNYFAPEQLLGSQGPATDVHAFGLTLFEALTGQRAFQAESLNTIAHDIMYTPVDLAPLRQQGIPKPLVDLVAQCTTKAPEQRPSMHAVSAELKTIAHAINAIAPAEKHRGAQHSDRAHDQQNLTAELATGTLAGAAPTDRMQVFLCHASADKPAVRTLYC